MQNNPCINDNCKRCDIGYIIKDYMKPLMQALTIQIREYNMRLVESKCLNTAVSIFTLLFGNNALKHTIYCDVQNVQQRHKEFKDNNAAIAKKMEEDVLRKTKSRYVYYSMLTDGIFVLPDGTKRNFPGHVFLIEKIPWGDDVFYYIYQSYIDKYTFTEYVTKYKSIKVTKEKMEYYMKSINNMVNNRVWDADFIRFWEDMTKVNTNDMLGGVPDGAFLV